VGNGVHWTKTFVGGGGRKFEGEYHCQKASPFLRLQLLLYDGENDNCWEDKFEKVSNWIIRV